MRNIKYDKGTALTALGGVGQASLGIAAGAALGRYALIPSLAGLYWALWNKKAGYAAAAAAAAGASMLISGAKVDALGNKTSTQGIVGDSISDAVNNVKSLAKGAIKGFFIDKILPVETRTNLGLDGFDFDKYLYLTDKTPTRVSTPVKRIAQQSYTPTGSGSASIEGIDIIDTISGVDVLDVA